MNDELETATAPGDERTRLYGDRSQRPLVTRLWAREVRMIRAGAYPCAQCKHRPGTVPSGDPRHLRPLCPGCAVDDKLDRSLARQRERREAMRARG